MKKIIVVLALLFPCASLANDKADRAVEILKQLCVAPGGSDLNLSADVTGGLIIERLKDTVITGSITIHSRELDGFVDGISNQIEAEQANRIRECMKPYIMKIVSTILDTVDTGAVDSSGRPPRTYSEADRKTCQGMISAASSILDVTTQSATLTSMIRNTLNRSAECSESLAKIILDSNVRSKALSLVSDRYLAEGRCSKAKIAADKILLVGVQSEQLSKVSIAMSQPGRCR